MRSFWLLFFLLALTSASIAQKGLLFINKKTNREIFIKEGDLVKFSYNGYIHQREHQYGIVMSIEDSLIEMASPNSSLSNKGMSEVRYIYTKDITGFRKFHRSRPYLISLSNVVIAAGSIYLYYEINKKSNLTFGKKLGISIGTGLVGKFFERLIFPDKIKYKIGEEWKVEVLK
ncbi:MAG TPA: hypothetical protein VK766_00805 [Cytophagaceae bacterium]|jgi:hypothetical protein|nr:hypothetical protein [Cytophagaceae bacterium]